MHAAHGGRAGAAAPPRAAFGVGDVVAVQALDPPGEGGSEGLGRGCGIGAQVVDGQGGSQVGRRDRPLLVVGHRTPPHFWALSLRIAKDYAAAGVPMLPVVRGTAETTRQILLYTILLVAVTLVTWAVAQMGLIYLAAAVALGAILLWQAGRLARTVTVEGTTAGAIRPYRYSISYLTLLFAAVAVDALVPTGWGRRERRPSRPVGIRRVTVGVSRGRRPGPAPAQRDGAHRPAGHTRRGEAEGGRVHGCRPTALRAAAGSDRGALRRR